jgi:hypothetical protein
VFDGMRKVTSSLPFRAQGLLALSVFVQDYLHRPRENGEWCAWFDASPYCGLFRLMRLGILSLDPPPLCRCVLTTMCAVILAFLDAADALDLLEKIMSVIDAHISNVNYSTAAAATSIGADEVELFCVCLQRLTVVCCALSLRLYNQGVIEADRLHTGFNSVRLGVFNDSSSGAVRNESLAFFTYVIPVDTTGRYTDMVLSWFKTVLRRCDDYSLAALNGVIIAVQPLLKANHGAACKVGVANCFLSTLLGHNVAVRA